MFATSNGGKLRELSAMFEDVPVGKIGLSEFADVVEVEETGTTFHENAGLKARGYAVQTGRYCIADDSGLEIQALDNFPGVHSARFAVGDQDSANSKLISMLNENPRQRGARFVCAMSVADPDGNVLHTSTGICRGTIAHEPRGEGGFGYDPIFIPIGYAHTFGELDVVTKNAISHRARAARRLIRFLLHFISVSHLTD